MSNAALDNFIYELLDTGQRLRDFAAK